MKDLTLLQKIEREFDSSDGSFRNVRRLLLKRKKELINSIQALENRELFDCDCEFEVKMYMCDGHSIIKKAIERIVEYY